MAGTIPGAGITTPLTLTTADNLDTLTLKSTDADANVGPVLNFNRDSSSPADNDFLGTIDFQGDNDAGETHDYIRVLSRALDVSNGAEKADLVIKDATGNNIVNFAHTEVVYNDDSLDRDFRVESNGDANCLLVNAGDDKVQIGRNADSGVTDIGIDLFNFSQINLFRDASSNVFAVIFNNTDTSAAIGSIRMNGSATTFNTSSDYRLKENVDYDWDATTRLKQLKPARFNWIADDTNTLLEGFLAHEVSSIVPEAISGEKDKVATADDVAAGIASSVGDAIHQGIDQSKLVPLMVKTIQELEARIKTLEDA